MAAAAQGRVGERLVILAARGVMATGTDPLRDAEGAHHAPMREALEQGDDSPKAHRSYP